MDSFLERMWNAFCVAFVENRKMHAVKSDESAESREPQITVGRLRYRKHRVSRQPFVGCPRIKTILCLRRIQRHKQTKVGKYFA